MGYNGTCPIPAGDYENYHISFPVPKFPLPWWLTDVRLFVLFIFLTQYILYQLKGTINTGNISKVSDHLF